MNQSDTLLIIALLSSVSSLMISILTHIKSSTCYGMKLRTVEDSSINSSKEIKLENGVQDEVKDKKKIDRLETVVGSNEVFV